VGLPLAATAAATLAALNRTCFFVLIGRSFQSLACIEVGPKA
jgi:hypothetical protein